MKVFCPADSAAIDERHTQLLSQFGATDSEEELELLTMAYIATLCFPFENRFNQIRLSFEFQRRTNQIIAILSVFPLRADAKVRLHISADMIPNESKEFDRNSIVELSLGQFRFQSGY